MHSDSFVSFETTVIIYLVECMGVENVIKDALPKRTDSFRTMEECIEKDDVRENLCNVGPVNELIASQLQYYSLIITSLLQAQHPLTRKLLL